MTATTADLNQRVSVKIGVAACSLPACSRRANGPLSINAAMPNTTAGRACRVAANVDAGRARGEADPLAAWPPDTPLETEPDAPGQSYSIVSITANVSNWGFE